MTAPPAYSTTNPPSVVALQQRLDAALADKTALAQELAARNAELAARNDYQNATIDVLKMMSASPGDPQPVFDLIARRACEVCHAPGSSVITFDGNLAHFVGAYALKRGFLEPEAASRFQQSFPRPLHKDSISCRAMIERRTVHIRDVPADPDVSPDLIAAGQKSNLAVPLLRDGSPLGAISLSSDKLGGFSDTQIALLETFAEQAAIAVASAETYRALQARTADLQESLEQQTATAEVLQVINASPGNLTPVFDAMLERAMRLCGAAFGSLYTYDGERFHSAAQHGVPPAFAAYRAANPPLTTPGGGPAIILATRRPHQVLDITVEVDPEIRTGG